MGANQATNFSKKLETGNQTTDNYIDSLSTFNKIIMAQSLLKEMYSLKERFEENKDKMVEKIVQNSYKYYKNKLNLKEIYDYFESNNLEVRNNYKLINNSKIFDKNKKLHDFLFFLRNNNSFLIQIINKCEPKHYKDLSYFIVHFLYEDTTNCSFFQEELLLIIYLYLENTIIKTLPLKLNSSILQKERELYNTNQIQNNFIYHLFYSLTKKADIRNYLCSSLSEVIIKIEENQEYLTTEPKEIAKILGFQLEQILDKAPTAKIKKNKSKENIFEENNEIHLKDNKKLKLAIKQSINNVKKRISLSGTIVIDGKVISDINAELKNYKKKEVINYENISTDKIKIDPFFNHEDINYMYIINKINHYENIKEKSQKDFAMIEYLDILLNDITKDGEPVEVYSTILLKNDLKIIRMSQSSDNYEKMVNKIKRNYDQITSIITILLIKIRENINLIPFSMKCIFKIIEELFNKKYQNLKKETFNFQLLMMKARIFFGCMIIPMIANIHGSGIFTDGIISKIANNNINIIVSILKILISGNLFLIKNAGYTIYNTFIIDSLPNIFDIINDIDQNINLPDFIKNLIRDIPENIDKSERIINYDYFKEKEVEKEEENKKEKKNENEKKNEKKKEKDKNYEKKAEKIKENNNEEDEENEKEKIQFQSICFSWKDIAIILKTINADKNFFISKSKYKEKLEELLCDCENYLIESLKKYQEDKSNKILEYYLATKIIYQKKFENQINSIIKDNFEILFQGEADNEALRFKKCLTEVLAYVNHLQKDDFSLLNKSKTQILCKNSIIKKFENFKRKTLYENTTFNKKNQSNEVQKPSDLLKIKDNLKKIENYSFYEMRVRQFYLKRKSSIIKDFNQIKKNEQLDFKNDIFPQIASKAMSEIFYNPNNDKSQRIIFCISYMKEHIDDLPSMYTKNNFNQIFLDILKEPEKLIMALQHDILNKFHSKIRNSEKLNLISSKDFIQIKNMERYSYAGHLFNKIILKGNLTQNITNGKINSLMLDLNLNNNDQSNINTIQSFIDQIPNFRIYELKKENILNLEKNLKIDDLINNYFKEIKNIVKKDEMISKFSVEDLLLITYELENYILYKLYDKLYPKNSTQEDDFLYKKCCRLNFIKPENIIKDKKMINEKLLEISINYIMEMDTKFTPIDKIKNFGKAIDILKNSMTFNSGKTDLGLDDTLPFIIYIVLKSKPKNIYTNLNDCSLFINPDLSKRQFGNMLTQLQMVLDIIKNMKYNELINVTEEQFGKD